MVPCSGPRLVVALTLTTTQHAYDLQSLHCTPECMHAQWASTPVTVCANLQSALVRAAGLRTQSQMRLPKHEPLCPHLRRRRPVLSLSRQGHAVGTGPHAAPHAATQAVGAGPHGLPHATNGLVGAGAQAVGVAASRQLGPSCVLALIGAFGLAQLPEEAGVCRHAWKWVSGFKRVSRMGTCARHVYACGGSKAGRRKKGACVCVYVCELIYEYGGGAASEER